MFVEQPLGLSGSAKNTREPWTTQGVRIVAPKATTNPVLQPLLYDQDHDNDHHHHHYHHHQHDHRKIGWLGHSKGICTNRQTDKQTNRQTDIATKKLTGQDAGLVKILLWTVKNNRPRPGYQKALERGKSVPQPKGFCEADKVKRSAVLSQNPKCRNLRLFDILKFYENMDLLVFLASCEFLSWQGRPSLPVRGPASL